LLIPFAYNYAHFLNLTAAYNPNFDRCSNSVRAEDGKEIIVLLNGGTFYGDYRIAQK
jgi:hypothetical protein